MKNKLQKGFTVLEFLIVVAIIMILLAIILPSLQTARERSYDDKRVTDLKTISLELEQFKQACGAYPDKILAAAGCDNDINTTLEKYIPEIAQYNFNDQSAPNYISYTPFSINPGDSTCVAYHLAIVLKNETTGIFANGDANINSVQNPNIPYGICGSSGASGIDGTEIHTYDIFKQ